VSSAVQMPRMPLRFPLRSDNSAQEDLLNASQAYADFRRHRQHYSICHKTSAGRGEYDVDNAFDRAFGASNAEVEREIQENTKCDSKPIEMTETEIFDFSQRANSDIRPAGFHRSLSCFSDISLNNASPINSVATTPSLLSSNSVNNFKGSSQITTPRLCTGKETGTTGSQNIPGAYQQYGKSDLSKLPRQLYLKPRETECPPWLFTSNQQTPTNINPSPLSSPATSSVPWNLLRKHRYSMSQAKRFRR
jgi:hypothetical protein